jgi:ABC-type transport system substrate-binding protein
MKKMKRFMALLCLLLMILALPVSATEPAATEMPVLSPRIVGVWNLSGLPDNWNPLEVRNGDQEAILSLTAEPLYRLGYDGSVESAQAAALPVDVTAEFAGTYEIPEYAGRGYAFAIELRAGAFWEDGKALTAADWSYTVEMLLAKEKFPLALANHRAFLRGDTHPAQKIVSLMDAGFDSVAQAQEAGIRDFYVDTTYFWGLDTGWRRTTDRTRLFDAAIPSGCEEMYVTAAYLYRQYLSDTGSENMFQSEFVGIPVESGEALTMDDVGLLVQDNRLILILQEPATATHVALALSGLYPVPQGTDAGQYGSASAYRSCGPYRIESMTNTEIILVPNPHWTGEKAEFETVFCRTGS